jgi:hypothetical protein
LAALVTTKCEGQQACARVEAATQQQIRDLQEKLLRVGEQAAALEDAYHTAVVQQKERYCRDLKEFNQGVDREARRRLQAYVTQLFAE